LSGTKEHLPFVDDFFFKKEVFLETKKQQGQKTINSLNFTLHSSNFTLHLAVATYERNYVLIQNCLISFLSCRKREPLRHLPDNVPGIPEVWLLLSYSLKFWKCAVLSPSRISIISTFQRFSEAAKQ
jgi:hypothetical protein